MVTPLIYALPYPPTVNTYWRHVVCPGRGKSSVRVLISKAGRAYRKFVRVAVGRVEPISGRLHVVLRVHPPDRRKRDLDNLPKALLDALEHAGVYDDDSQIDWLEVKRESVMSGGCVFVTIARCEV